jgi:hypothetical protein
MWLANSRPSQLQYLGGPVWLEADLTCDKLSGILAGESIRSKSFDDVCVALAMDYDGLRLQFCVLLARW